MGSVCDKGVSSAGVLTASVPVREFRTAAEHEGKARASVAPAYQGFSPCACPTQAPRGGSGRYKHLPCEELARASWSASVNPRFKLIFYLYPAILPQNFGLKFDGVHTARTSSASWGSKRDQAAVSGKTVVVPRRAGPVRRKASCRGCGLSWQELSEAKSSACTNLTKTLSSAARPRQRAWQRATTECSTPAECSSVREDSTSRQSTCPLGPSSALATNVKWRAPGRWRPSVRPPARYSRFFTWWLEPLAVERSPSPLCRQRLQLWASPAQASLRKARRPP